MTDPFISRGYNVIGSGEGADAFEGSGDINEVPDPSLDDLDDNGGPTQTHALLQDSPALDRVAEDVCPSPNTDQRGASRPQDGDENGTSRCDSGSFELESPASPRPSKPAAKANLSLTKKASKGRPTVGQKLAYILRLKNNGPDRATNTKIVDILPRGVKLAASSTGCKKQSARKVVCSLGTLADGKSVARKITVKVKRSGKLVNRARASSNVSDPNSKNNSARAVVRAKVKARQVAKTKLVSCRVKSPLARLAQGKQVVVADTKAGRGTACVVQGNQLALARSLKNRRLGVLKQRGRQVRVAKGKVVEAGARKVAVRVPRGF
ncbi:MAG: choice-of-anchor Q domain-containing protein [Rubrobacteraceae bacterium]